MLVLDDSRRVHRDRSPASVASRRGWAEFDAVADHLHTVGRKSFVRDGHGVPHRPYCGHAGGPACPRTQRHGNDGIRRLRSAVLGVDQAQADTRSVRGQRPPGATRVGMDHIRPGMRAIARRTARASAERTAVWRYVQTLDLDTARDQGVGNRASAAGRSPAPRNGGARAPSGVPDHLRAPDFEGW